MNEKPKGSESDALYEAILTLGTIDECRRFFEDICTVGELLSLTQRLAVAKCLSEGRTNAETKKLTGAASATISRVNRSLKYGNDGYRTVIKRLGADKNAFKEEVSNES